MNAFDTVLCTLGMALGATILAIAIFFAAGVVVELTVLAREAWRNSR